MDLINALLFREPEQSALEVLVGFGTRAVGGDVQLLIQKTDNDNEVIGARFSKACYISGSWPGVLYLACKYLRDPKAGLLSNTNLGGDNVHRGAVLGLILGLAANDGMDSWFSQLTEAAAIDREIKDLLGQSEE